MFVTTRRRDEAPRRGRQGASEKATGRGVMRAMTRSLQTKGRQGDLRFRERGGVVGRYLEVLEPRRLGHLPEVRRRHRAQEPRHERARRVELRRRELVHQRARRLHARGGVGRRRRSRERARHGGACRRERRRQPPRPAANGTKHVPKNVSTSKPRGQATALGGGRSMRRVYACANQRPSGMQCTGKNMHLRRKRTHMSLLLALALSDPRLLREAPGRGERPRRAESRCGVSHG